jgi:hypothetical protein
VSKDGEQLVNPNSAFSSVVIGLLGIPITCMGAVEGGHQGDQPPITHTRPTDPFTLDLLSIAATLACCSSGGRVQPTGMALAAPHRTESPSRFWRVGAAERRTWRRRRGGRRRSAHDILLHDLVANRIWSALGRPAIRVPNI